VSTPEVVFLGFRISKRQPTPGYPYGYERAEDLAGLGVALVIWASAAFAGYVSVGKLIDNGATTQVGVGIAGAALGIVGNQVVARYKLIIGSRSTRVLASGRKVNSCRLAALTIDAARLCKSTSRLTYQVHLMLDTCRTNDIN
jgi:hypothetical protein